MHGGEALAITAELGRAGAEALAPYVRGGTRLRTLMLRKTKLDTDGMGVLAAAPGEHTCPRRRAPSRSHVVAAPIGE